jgi:ribosomal protein S21
MPKVKVRNNNVEAALRVFKKKASETIWDYKQKEYYVPKSEKRRLARQAAIARFKRKRRDDGRNKF